MQGTLPMCWTENEQPVEVLLAYAEQVRLGCLTVIVVENAAQQRSTAHRAFGFRGQPWQRGLLRQPLLRPCLIIIGLVFPQHPPQMRLVEAQELVKAFLAVRAHPALGTGIGIWRTKRRADDMRALRLKDRIECRGELGVAVVDHKVDRRGSPVRFPGHLPGLLGHPGGVGPIRTARQKQPRG